MSILRVQQQLNVDCRYLHQNFLLNFPQLYNRKNDHFDVATMNRHLIDCISHQLMTSFPKKVNNSTAEIVCQMVSPLHLRLIVLVDSIYQMCLTKCQLEIIVGKSRGWRYPMHKQPTKYFPITQSNLLIFHNLSKRISFTNRFVKIYLKMYRYDLINLRKKSIDKVYFPLARLTLQPTAPLRFKCNEKQL